MKLLKFFLIAFISMNTAMVLGQISLSEKSHDFGIVLEDTKLWFDLKVINKSDSATRLVKMTNPDGEFEYKFSAMEIPKGQSIDIRVQFKPLEKGNRNIELSLFFDKESLDFKIKANVKNLQREYTACPDFDKPSTAKKSFETEFYVYNKLTKETISNATIDIDDFKQNIFTFSTNKNGFIKSTIPLSHYLMYVSANGFKSIDSSSYINSRLNKFEFYLTPLVADEVPDELITSTEEIVVVEEEIPTEIEVVIEEKVVDIIEKTPIEEEVKDEEMIEIIETEVVLEEINPEFSKQEYKANNIVFLMDVSTSMKKEDRLIMLKKALISLSEILRDNDVVSLITYASTTEVLIEGYRMDDKDLIQEIINSIDGRGTTAGGKGIKKAYQLAAKHKIEGGNNHVYIATDGAFNKNDDSLVKSISKQAQRGVKLSVISLNSSDFATKKMLELAKAGKGDFVDIKDMNMVDEKLIEVVKKQSKKGK